MSRRATISQAHYQAAWDLTMRVSTLCWQRRFKGQDGRPLTELHQAVAALLTAHASPQTVTSGRSLSLAIESGRCPGRLEDLAIYG